MNKKVISVILALVMCTTIFSTVAFAAASTDPYGYYWWDSVENRLAVDYYKYRTSDRAFYIEDGVEAKNNTIYGHGYTRNDLKASDADNIAYDRDGTLWYITTGGALMSKGIGTTTWQTMWSSGASRIIRNVDDIGIEVVTTSGTKRLSELRPDGTNPPSTGTPQAPDTSNGHYVLEKKETTGNMRMYMEYYQNRQLQYRIYFRGPNVWVEQANTTISEHCKGAKFMGIDSQGAVYLYELDGTLVKFQNGKWNRCIEITCDGDLKYFSYDRYGFAVSFSTQNGTYNLDGSRR